MQPSPTLAPATAAATRLVLRPGPTAARSTGGPNSAFVGASGTEDDGLLFAVEGTIPNPRSANAGAGRDLAVEATIIDIQDIAAPTSDRDPLRGLRRAVAAHSATRRFAGAAAAAPITSSYDDPVADLAEAIAEALEGTGARVAVRAAATAAAGAAAAPAPAAARGVEAFVLRGRFIVVKGPLDTREEGIIIDPNFREAFRIAPATPGYQRLVDALPEVFVGDASALRRLAALITAQAARSYESQGLTQPPWRRYGAMIARWLPPRARYTDTPVSPPASPLKRLSSGEASALALATAREAAAGALTRLAAATGANAPPVPARVIRGFDVPTPFPVAAGAV